MKAKKFDPKNRGLNQLPIKHLDDFDDFDDGKTNKTRLVGTWARFPTGSDGRTKFQLHRWCVCDVSKDKANKESATYPGHWVSTQGNSSNSSAAHPNQGTDGCSFSKFVADPDKAGPGSAKGKGKNAAAAATSNSTSTVADADLKRATAHIDHLKAQLEVLTKERDAEHLKYAKAIELANIQLNFQVRKTNELIYAHARTLRTSQVETAKAIAKIDQIRGICEGFAENMLTKATEGNAPDLDTKWSAFSGVLTSEQLEAADWGGTKKKVVGTRSINVFNITAFERQEVAAPPTPIQHTVYQLSDSKVNALPTPEGYEPPVDHAKFLLKWATGKKRKRNRSSDDDDDSASDGEEEEDEDEDEDDDDDEDSQ